MDVIVGLYKGSKSESKATNDGLKVFNVSDACDKADWPQYFIRDERGQLTCNLRLGK